ncbi:MAG: MSMEG_0570 family nitrogen starvation response protein, partial [Actinomycetota bacterium]|nr:MSMEG_0570 family nitrogen starvation response protein [Actinomycetota bacterium]
MPELYFRVRWPDGTIRRCYSPSLVVRDHFESGAAYPLDRFVALSRTALTQASDRVRERYGMACTSAAQELEEIEATAARFAGDRDATV